MIDALRRSSEQTLADKFDFNTGKTGYNNESFYPVSVPVDQINLKWIVNRIVSNLRFTKSQIVLVATFFLLISAAVATIFFQAEFQQIHLERIETSFGWGLMIATMSIFAYKIGFYLFSLFLYLKYRPIESVSDKELPTCTVIVPAFNEGEQVLHTLRSLTASDYPAEKLELLAIDDGSTDDTWYWMQEAKRELGDRISIYQQPRNKGKRHALYRGFNIGSGQVFVTVDSDSEVKADTLRNLVSPFVVNENCGAVAGNVQVLNSKSGIIPRMLNVSFVFSFEFVRAAESKLKTVLCTPGALAAYRREAVFGCLPEWINQRFMGKPSDIGEDRAMTNMILKQGYETMFQSNAHVLTQVPERYKGLSKMFIRWGRSNVRENIMMSRFVFSNFRNEGKAGARLLFVNQWIKLIMAYPAIVLMLMFLVSYPLLSICATLVSILIFGSIPVMIYARRYQFSRSVWAYPYALFFAFGLFWITPYAIATAGRRGWLTRG